MNKGIIATCSTIVGVIGGVVGSTAISNKTIAYKEAKVDKFKCYYNLLNKWLIIKQEGKLLEKYFLDNEYRSIAIYGMGEMGNRLYEELKGSSVKVKYAIDKNADSTFSELDVIEIDESLEMVDAIVVTAIFAFNTIEKELSRRIKVPIISLEDVVFEIE